MKVLQQQRAGSEQQKPGFISGKTPEVEQGLQGTRASPCSVFQGQKHHGRRLEELLQTANVCINAGGGGVGLQDRRCKEALSAIDPLTAALSVLEGVSSTDASWEMTAGLQAGRTS